MTMLTMLSSRLMGGAHRTRTPMMACTGSASERDDHSRKILPQIAAITGQAPEKNDRAKPVAGC